MTSFYEIVARCYLRAAGCLLLAPSYVSFYRYYYDYDEDYDYDN